MYMDKKVNAKGQTLEEFLAAYNPAKYRHPAVTADCVVFCGDSVLLVRRGNHPYIGELAFPGGFAEPGGSTETTACRELEEETGAVGVPMRQFYTASTPGRDPRDWTVSVCYVAELGEMPSVAGGEGTFAERRYKGQGAPDPRVASFPPGAQTVKAGTMSAFSKNSCDMGGVSVRTWYGDSGR